MEDLAVINYTAFLGASLSNSGMLLVEDNDFSMPESLLGKPPRSHGDKIV